MGDSRADIYISWIRDDATVDAGLIYLRARTERLGQAIMQMCRHNPEILYDPTLKEYLDKVWAVYKDPDAPEEEIVRVLEECVKQGEGAPP